MKGGPFPLGNVVQETETGTTGKLRKQRNKISTGGQWQGYNFAPGLRVWKMGRLFSGELRHGNAVSSKNMLQLCSWPPTRRQTMEVSTPYGKLIP